MKLKKIVLSLTAVCVLSFGAAALLLHSAQSFADSGDRIINVNEQAAENLNHVSQIEILNKTGADVRFLISGPGKVTAHLYGTVSGNVEMNRPTLSIVKNGKTRSISAGWNKNWQRRVWFNVHYRCDLKLDIAIPSDYTGGIRVVTNSGDILATELHGSILEITSSSGDVNLSNFSGKGCDISTASGDVIGKNIQSERMGINTASGDIRLTDSRAPEFRARSASGEITVESVKTNTFSTHSASGDLTLIAVTGKDISANSSSGEINVTDISGDNLSFATSSGDIRLRKVSGNLTVHTTSGDVKGEIGIFPNYIKVTTTSGDIRLRLSGKEPFGFHGESHGTISFTGPDGQSVTSEKKLDLDRNKYKKQVSVQSVSGDIEVN